MNKSEREKMISGELYDASDAELSKGRLNARKLLHRLNQSGPEQAELRMEVFKELFGGFSGYLGLEPPFYCDYGFNIHFGENTFLNFNCIFLDCAEIRIGSEVMFGPNVQLYTASHPLDADKRAEGPELAFPITIGDHCWLGGGVIVCPGVTIGERSVIGAGSVVTKDIPSGVFAAGNPCKVIKAI